MNHIIISARSYGAESRKKEINMDINQKVYEAIERMKLVMKDKNISYKQLAYDLNLSFKTVYNTMNHTHTNTTIATAALLKIYED